jgi:selenocysteine lyase/cysteine desulfurase
MRNCIARLVLVVGLAAGLWPPGRVAQADIIFLRNGRRIKDAWIVSERGDTVTIVIIKEGAALRGKLRANASQLREGLVAIGLDPGASAGPIIPVILEQSARVMRVARSLREANVLVGAIRPPTVPSGSARLRISVTAAHEPRDIERLLAALARSLVP